MDQSRLLELLKEAARSDCTSFRRREIELELLRAAPGGEDELAPRNDLKAGIRAILMRLYTKVTEENPGALPGLFPVFALICGDCHDDTFARINWQLFILPLPPYPPDNKV